VESNSNAEAVDVARSSWGFSSRGAEAAEADAA
jgi:hypothetical protein